MYKDAYLFKKNNISYLISNTKLNNDNNTIILNNDSLNCTTSFYLSASNFYVYIIENNLNIIDSKLIKIKISSNVNIFDILK